MLLEHPLPFCQNIPYMYNLTNNEHSNHVGFVHSEPPVLSPHSRDLENLCGRKEEIKGRRERGREGSTPRETPS